MRIITIPLGFTNSYLVQGTQGYIMVDAGVQRQAAQFKRRLQRLNISPDDIKLLLITHAHFDHVGSLVAIQEICDCPVIMHPLEEAVTEQGLVVIPPGTNWWGKFVSDLGKNFKSWLVFPPAKADLLVEQEFKLDDYGVAGRIIPTPGHTPGSLSVLLEDGQALVGDLATNFPLHRAFPPFAEAPATIYKSWELIKSLGAKKIYPAHGKPFSVERLITHESIF